MPHQFAHGVENFVKRGVVLVCADFVHAEFAEKIGLALGPVQLVKVEVIGVQPFEAGVAGFDDLRARKIVVAAADIAVEIVVAGGAGDFAGEHDIITPPARLNPRADVLLGGGVGFLIRRHGIHFGGVDKIHALREGVIELLVRLGLGVLFAPSHGAEADSAHFYAGAAQFVILHGGVLSVSGVAASCGKYGARLFEPNRPRQLV